GYYAIAQGTDLVFVIDKATENFLKDVEFRDRTAMKFDLATTKFHSAKVKELTVKLLILSEKDEDTVQHPIVLEREGKEGWKAKSGLPKLDLDQKKVNELVAKVSDLKVERYLDIKMPAPADYRLDDKVKIDHNKPNLVVTALIEHEWYF